MDAALELAASTRSLASLGLREVARHAGLNPNTFYRHFKNFDELGLAMIQELGVDLRQGLRARRLQAAADGFRLSDSGDPAQRIEQAQDVIRQSISLVLDSTTDHQSAYIVGIRELFGTSPVLRKAVRQLLEDIAIDMRDDLLGVLELPGVTDEQMHEIAFAVIRQMVFFSMDYLEQPERRDQIRRQAERFILMLFWGALAAKAPELVLASGARFPSFDE